MEKQKKTKHSIFSAFCYGLFSIVLCLSAVSKVEAATIVCGSGNNCLCDTETRQCVKYTAQRCTTMPSSAGATTSCVDYIDYKCIGKREPMPNKAEVVTVSTDASGYVLTPEEEKRELRSKHPAEKTDFEKKEITTEYYKDKDQLDISEDVRNILNRTKNKEEKDETLGQDDTQDCLNAIAALSKYTTAAGYDEGMGSPGDSRLLDAYQKAQAKLKDVYDDKYISEEDYRIVKAEIDKLYKEAVHRIETAANKAGDTEKAKQVQEELADAVKEYAMAECPTSGQLRSRYHAGCWSCLVLERLTSAFLHAANHGLKVVQKAGLTLLWLGTAIWIVFWGLKNVSSFTQIELGNILNDLIKFLFKVAVAYWFIVYSPTAISQYFIKPIMSVGAIIAQQFWDTKVKEFTFEWGEDVYIADDSPLVEQTKEAIRNRIEEDQPKVSQTPIPQTPEVEKDVPQDEPVPIDPKASDEQIVIALQKAFINYLRRQIQEIMNSCGGSCAHANGGKACRTSGCGNRGHQNYVKNLFCWAQQSKSGTNCGYNAYCQAAVSAAMAKALADVAGGTQSNAFKKLNIFKGFLSHPMAFTNGGKKGGNSLCKGNKLAVKLSPGDVIGINGDSKGTSYGKSSGHHTITIIDPNKPSFISFNGDTQEGKNFCTYYSQPRGKVYSVSTEWRRILKENPELKKQLDLKKLAQLSAGINMSFVNYEGVSFSNIGMDDAYAGGSGEINYDDLVVEIPEITYTGPTNIMPKSVMNSILGATRAITDTTADVMVMGDMIMCYSSAKNGGAWHIDAKILDLGYWTNIIMWLQGGIIWCLGFMLTVSIAYYLVDISFKIGFAVLAIPVMMGLWPFGFTQSKIFIAISIIAKSAATFAFLALTTAFGMGLVGEAVNGLEELYGNMDALTQGETDEEEIRSRVSETLSVASSTFVLLIFAILYFYKMVQQTIPDLVNNKFFPDQAFGDSSPMHSGATMATSYLKKFAMKASGADLAKDIVAHQTGRLVKGGLKKTGAVASYPIRHPMKSARAVAHAVAHPVKTGKAAGQGIKKGWNKITGKE